MQELYVVYFESANYCGYGEHCLVWATNEDDARDRASEYAEEFYQEQDTEQYLEEHCEGSEDELEGVTWASIERVYPLASDEAKDIRGYLEKVDQAAFYPIINIKE